MSILETPQDRAVAGDVRAWLDAFKQALRVADRTRPTRSGPSRRWQTSF